MVTFEVVPGVGIGPIRFGFTREQVNKALGMEPLAVLPRNSEGHEQRGFYYPDLVLHVDYSENGSTVEWIGITNSAQICLTYKGIELFPVEMDELANLISKETPLAENDSELGYSYIFPILELALWRESTPKDFDFDDDNEDRDEDWYKEDFEKSKYCTTISLGVKGYYSENSI